MGALITRPKQNQILDPDLSVMIGRSYGALDFAKMDRVHVSYISEKCLARCTLIQMRSHLF